LCRQQLCAAPVFRGAKNRRCHYDPPQTSGGRRRVHAACRAIDRGIATSEKDYKEGRSHGPFKTHEAFVASLHAETAKLRKRKSKRTAK